MRRASPAFLLMPLLALGLAACAGGPARSPQLEPTHSVLEVVALLRMHVDDDTYRFAPARDFSGKNVYSASLRRLESLEQIHGDKLATGYLLDVVPFAKARALERLGEFELAALHYERVSRLDSPLAEPATEGQAVCAELHRARLLRPDSGAAADGALDVLRARRALLEALAERARGGHYAHVLAEELERTDRVIADYFAARSRLEPELDAFALQQQQEVVRLHRDSKLYPRHMLALGDFYSELARRYVDRVPPQAIDFDPALFDEYAFGAARVYEAVSHRDGAIEKIEASRKLEAFLAFTLQVYDERLPQ